MVQFISNKSNDKSSSATNLRGFQPRRLITTNPAVWWRAAAIFVIAFIFVSGIVYLIRRPTTTEAGWFNDFWRYRQTISITNAGSALTDYQVPVVVDTATLISAGKVSPNCSDIRFTDYGGNVLPYWIEENNPGCNSATTKIWVKIPSISTAGAIIFIYYGNASASSYTNGDDTFTFFDGFDGISLDANKWVSSGTVTVGSGVATINYSSYIRSLATTNSMLDGGRLIMEGFMKYNSSINRSMFGMVTTNYFGSNEMGSTAAGLNILRYTNNDYYHERANDASAGTEANVGDMGTITNYQRLRISWVQGSSAYFDTPVGPATRSDYIPNTASLYIHINVNTSDSNYLDWIFVRKNAAIEPVAGSLSNEEKATAPIAHWKFDEGYGTEVYNSMQANNSGVAPIAEWSLAAEDERYGSENITNSSIWTDSNSDGLADGYSYMNGTTTGASIVTGNGFDGNAQKFTSSQTSYKGFGFAGFSFFVQNKVYKISFKYRSNATLRVELNSPGAYPMNQAANTGAPQLAEYTFVQTSADPRLTFYVANSGEWFEIDDLTVKEVKAADKISNNDGTIYGAVYTTDRAGRSNAAMTFDGTNDYVEVSSNSVTEPGTGDFSVGYWIKRTDTTLRVHLAKSSTSTGTAWMIRKDYAMFYYDGSHRIDIPITLPVDTNWHYVVVTLDRSASPDIGHSYVDGVLSGGPTQGTLDGENMSNAHPFTIGKGDFSWFGGTYSNDSIANVKIYNYTRSADQIRADFETTKGYIVGATWTDESECISGKCLSFDGTNDQVAISNGDMIDIGYDSFTISTWIKMDSLPPANPRIISYAEDANNGYSLITYGGTSLNDFVFEVKKSGNIYGIGVNGSYAYEANKWYHLIGTFDNNTNTPKLYINGVIHSGSGGSLGLPSTTGVTYIGSMGGVNFFDGKIDEPKIYSYVLTAAQVKADYLAGQVGSSEPVSVKASGDSSLGSSSGNINDGLIGWWKMDEGSWSGVSGEVVDSSGKGNNGTAQGGVSTANGKFGRAGSFDGGSDYVNIPNIGNVTDGTIAMWFYFASNFAEETSSRSALFGFNKSGTASNETHVTFGNYTGGYSGELLTVNVNGDWSLWTGNQIFNQDYAPAGWHFFALTRDSSGGRFYIDGREITDAPVQSSGNPLTISTTTAPFHIDTHTINRIGAMRETIDYFNGKIDDVKLYNRALSAEEIINEYKTGPAPVAYWDFEEGEGSTLFDKSGNDNNGTLNNMDTSTDWVIGRRGGGLSFDGSNDYISFDNVSNIPIGDSSYTVSAWTKFDYCGNLGIIGWGDYGVAYNTNAFRAYADCRFRHYWWAADLDTGSNTLIANQWQYGTVTYDGLTRKMYIDGVLIISDTPNDHLVPYASNLTIGVTNDNTEYMAGTLDEVKIYNYARTPEQILQDMYGDNSAHPIAYYKFDEGKGSIAKSSAKTNDATNYGFWSNEAKLGKAVYLGEASKYVHFGNDVDFDSSTFSISLWLKIKDYSGQYSDGGNGNIILGRETYTVSGFRYGIRADNATPQFWTTQSGGTLSLTSNTSMNANQYNHLVITYDGTKGYMYLNGKQVASGTGTYIVPTGINLCAFECVGGVYFPKGYLDEFKYYTFALSPEQVRKDYNVGSAIVLGSRGTDASGGGSNSSATKYFPTGSITNGLVGYWKMDENSWSGVSGEVKDYVGGYHGDRSGNATTTTGKYGRAGIFDGSDDYISVDYNANLAPTSAITVSAWVKPNSVTTNSRIVAKTESGGYTLGFSIDGAADQNWFVWRNGAYGKVGWSNTNFTNGTWYHIAGTYDGRYMRFYVDGNLKETDDAGGSYPITYAVSNELCIGIEAGSSTCATTNDFDGAIDEVRIYNRALSSGEIAQLAERGPVAYYNFEEGSGGTAYDLSGNSHDGTLTTPVYALGKPGWALDFNGTTDYVSLTRFSFGSGGISLSAWVKTTSADSGKNYTGNAAQNVIGDNTNGVGLGFGLTGGKIQYNFYNGAWVAVTGLTNVNDGNWHNITATHNLNGDVILYLDGILDNTGNTTIGGSRGFNRIGGGYESWVTDLTGDEFDGLIDEVKVYDYVRTPAQVAWDYNGGQPIAWWKLDEKDGTTAKDSSGKGNNGTLTNMDGATDWVTGKFNNALDFDGTDDYISVTSSNNINLNTSDFSFTGWIKLSAAPTNGPILMKRESNSRMYEVSFSNSKLYVNYNYDNNYSYKIGNTALSTGVWYHVAAVVKRDIGYPTLYINGVDDGYTSRSLVGSPATTSMNNTGALHIGRSTYSGYLGYFPGLMDDIKIYNYALSPEQIKEIMNYGTIRFK